MSAHNGPTINTLATLRDEMNNFSNDVEKQQPKASNERPLYDTTAVPETLFMSGVFAQSNSKGMPEVISVQFFSTRKGAFRINVAGGPGTLTRSQRSLIRAALAQADEMEARGEM